MKVSFTSIWWNSFATVPPPYITQPLCSGTFHPTCIMFCFIFKAQQTSSSSRWYRRVASTGDENVPAFLRFKPLQEMSVIGPCDWEIRVSTMTNRIPERVSEILCRNQRSSCGGNPFYQVNKESRVLSSISISP